VLSSPRHDPIPRMQLRVFEKMGYGRCSNLSRAGIIKAAEREKGFIFWNNAVGRRKIPKSRESGESWERRFICKDCIENVFPLRA
jgi:hypothetical protein